MLIDASRIWLNASKAFLEVKMAAFKILMVMAAAIAVVAAVPHNVTVAAPTFVVNLDLPPEDRWTHIVELYKSSAPLIVNYFTHAVRLSSFSATIAPSLTSSIPHLAVDHRAHGVCSSPRSSWRCWRRSWRTLTMCSATTARSSAASPACVIDLCFIWGRGGGGAWSLW
jgi:hypothetical protein